MSDKGFLEKCLREIEEKLNWSEAATWKEPDFLKLAALISAESNISISPHTLKRLFGKIDYSKTYNPQKATKDALAKFLGYVDWDDYCTAPLPDNENHEAVDFKVDKIAGSQKKWIILIGAFFVLLLMIWFTSNKKEASTDDFAFHLKDSIGSVPFTAAVNYDIQNLTLDSILIDYDFVHPKQGAQFVIPKKDHFINNFTYQIPGYYKIQLQGDGSLLSSKNVLVTSDNWDSYLLYENGLNNFWLDNVIKSFSLVENQYMSPEQLHELGWDINKVFYVRHRLFKNFNIDGDNFILETRFKNTEDTGGISCYDFTLNLICSNSRNYFTLMEEGCSRYSGLKIGEKVLKGVDEDLSRFKLNHRDWNDLQVKVIDKDVEVFLNNELIYQGSYTMNNGKLLGIEAVFKGAGIWDFIRIKDLGTNVKFTDDFLINE